MSKQASKKSIRFSGKGKRKMQARKILFKGIQKLGCANDRGHGLLRLFLPQKVALLHITADNQREIGNSVVRC